MQINLERPDTHSIQSYSHQQVQINNQVYQSSLLVSSDSIDTDWCKTHIHDLNENDVDRIMQHNPEVVIVGHPHSGQFPSPAVQQLFANKRIGLETMETGAACRTFNVLLSEYRHVILALIIPDV